MANYRVSMPHRHTVVYEDANVKLEYGVELLINGIVIYCQNPKVVWGEIVSSEKYVERVKEHLEKLFKNGNVELG